MIIQNQVVSESGDEPITSSYLKNFIRVDFSTDDAIISSVIKSARMLVEQFIEQALVTKSLKAYFYNFEAWDEEGSYYNLTLPFSPVTAIGSVKVVGVDGTETVITDYVATGLEEKNIRVNRILSLTTGTNQGYIVGYTAVNTDIAEPIKQAIAMLAGEMYENRQDSAVDVSIASLPYNVKAILRPYKKTFI
jgi:uncharacterized phiE125 gp8 family phage protein